MKFKPGTYRTSELIDGGVLQIGDGYRAKNSELAPTGIPFARAGNINNGFQFDGADLFPAKDLAKVGDKKSRICDSVFTSKGTVGRIAYVKEGTQEFVYSPQLCYWRSLDFDVIDPRFMNFWMNGSEFRNQIDYLKGQTDMADYVSLRDQRNMSFTFPDITVQRDIARTLGDLDDKIELNHQINQTLEQIAQTIFKSWFVDFEPVKAKIEAKAAGRDPERAAMCAISGKLDPELDQLSPEHYQLLAATAALFPGALVESALGLIPEGWVVGGLDRLAALVTKSVSPSSEPDSMFEHYSIPAYDATYRPAFEVGESIKSNKYLVDSSSVLVSKLNPGTPRIWLPKVKTDRPVCSTEFMQFVPRVNADRSFVFLLMKSEPMQTQILQRVTGSTGSRQRAQPSQIAVLPIIIPKQSLRAAFCDVVAPLLEQMAITLDQSETFATLRDTMLPKLLSGEVCTVCNNSLLVGEG